jgi:hypothetical protein
MNRRQFLQQTLPLALGFACCNIARAQRPFSMPRPKRVPAGALNVKRFSARGDGVTNDTDAFYAASRAIMAAGGGSLYIPAGTYIVGKQEFKGGQDNVCWAPYPIIEIRHCPRPVTIIGEQGTILKAANGLRFGAFDPATGQPYTAPTQRFTDTRYLGDAYTMINLFDNAQVTIANLELDGNLQGLTLGGHWGDTGRQCGANGIVSIGDGKLLVQDVYTHHHGKDGLMLVHPGLTQASAPTPVTLNKVVSDSNARQGLSWTGGIGLTANHCKFINTGTVRFVSAPGAGVDIEAENSICRNGIFNDSEFANNHGCSVLAEAGDAANIIFNRCSIWGTKSWSVWANKPYMKFSQCNIHGALVNLYSDQRHPEASVHFLNCAINDLAHPVYGPVFLAHDAILVDMGGSNGPVSFDGCRIVSTRGMSFYTNSNLQHPTVIKNTTIVHQFAQAKGLPPALLQGIYMENVHFKEHFNHPQPQRAMLIRDCLVGPNVIVDGPSVTWRWRPFTGTIPQGLTPG